MLCTSFLFEWSVQQAQLHACLGLQQHLDGSLPNWFRA